MNTFNSKQNILKMLKNSKQPVSASILAKGALGINATEKDVEPLLFQMMRENLILKVNGRWILSKF